MFFTKIAVSAILVKNISKVNDKITTESLSINDLLENIEFVTKSIIARKQKNLSGSLPIWEIGKILTRARAGGASVIYSVRPPLQKNLPSKNLWLLNF